MTTSVAAGASDRTIAAFFRLIRPKQWLKNTLVFAAPAAAGVLDEPAQLLRTVVAFVAFCLAASGTYCLNDAADVEADRAHPTKQFRPVASGAISVGAARVAGVLLLLGSLVVSASLGHWQLPLAVAGYVAITTSYTIWWKHIAVIDVAAVAAGFVIRAIAGAAATLVEVSDWFLIVASFGSLFMVSGKRSAELEAAEDAQSQRAVLAQYPPQFLVYLRTVSSGLTLIAYTLFAFEKASVASSRWFEISIVPFVLAVLRYALRLDQGEGGAPEELILGDRTIQVLAVLWGLCFMAGVYVS